MNNFFRNLQNEARKLNLSPREKQHMRINLYTLMERTPAAAPAPQPIERAPRSRVPSPYWWFSPRFAAPMAALLLVAMGSGTAYAAQGALPGEPLYAVKVHVNEQVQVALATTPEAKAAVNAQIAQTRLEEAEQLAAQGDLDATTSQELADNFDAHAQAAEDITNDLQTQDPAAAAQLSATLDSSLQAHDAILMALGDDSNSTSTKDDSGALAAAIHAHEGDRGVGTLAVATAGAEPTVRTFAAMNPNASNTNASSSSTTQNASTTATPQSMPNATAQVALALQANASSSLAQAEDDYAAIKSNLSASTISQVEGSLTAINARMSAGASALASGNNGFAAANFEEALRLSVRLDAFIKAGKLNKNLLPSLLGSSGDEGKGKGSSSGKSNGPMVPYFGNSSDQNGQGHSGQSQHGQDGQSIQTSASSSSGNSSASVNVYTGVNDNEGERGSGPFGGSSQSDINISTSTESSDGHSSASSNVEIHASNSSVIEISN